MKIKGKHIVEAILSIPKTLYFNFRALPLRKALKLPFFVSYRMELGELQGKISVPDNHSLFMIKLGFGGSEGVPSGAGYFSCKKTVTLFLKEKHFCVRERQSGVIVEP